MTLRSTVLIFVTAALSLAATRASETPRETAVAAMIATGPAPAPEPAPVPRQPRIKRSLDPDPFDEKDKALGLLLLLTGVHTAHGR